MAGSSGLGEGGGDMAEQKIQYYAEAITGQSAADLAELLTERANELAIEGWYVAFLSQASTNAMNMVVTYARDLTSPA